MLQMGLLLMLISLLDSQSRAAEADTSKHQSLLSPRFPGIFINIRQVFHFQNRTLPVAQQRKRCFFAFAFFRLKSNE